MTRRCVRFEAAATGRMLEAMLASAPDEAGGILVGLHDRDDIVVLDGLPVPDSNAHVHGYQRDHALATAALDEYLASSPHPYAGYVGEWHTHPRPSDPSTLDLRSIVETAAETDLPVALAVFGWNDRRQLADIRTVVAYHADGQARRTPVQRTKVKGADMPRKDKKQKALKKFDLAAGYARRQDALAAALRIPASFTKHGTTIGDASEANWGEMLRTFLPARYGVGPIFAVDSKGYESQQIDLAIYDRQYSPLFFDSPGSGVLVVPVESVYAVFEVKQELNPTNLRYAAEKVSSVRRLTRTSAPVYQVDGITEGKRPENQPIIGGLITQRVTWRDITSSTAKKNLLAFDGTEKLDIGLALNVAAFDISGRDIEFSPDGTQLIYFALHLFKRLRPLATALAPDIDAYEAALKRMKN